MVYNRVEYAQNRKIEDVFYFAHLITLENFTPMYSFMAHTDSFRRISLKIHPWCWYLMISGKLIDCLSRQAGKGKVMKNKCCVLAVWLSSPISNISNVIVTQLEDFNIIEDFADERWVFVEAIRQSSS